MTKQRSDGEGSLYPRHKPGCERPVRNGRPACKCPWQGAFVTGYRTDPETGKARPVRRKVTGRTRAEAAAKLRELQEKAVANELPAVGKALTVEQWLTYWLEKIAPKGRGGKPLKPSTLRTYATLVNRYIIPLIGHHKLELLATEHIEEAWDQLLENGCPVPEVARKVGDDGVPEPLAPNSVHQCHRVLSRALKVAVQRKRLRVNPAGSDCMDAPPREEKEIVPLTQAEVDLILATAAGEWNAARWRVALALGLRQGEALGLRWEDVDLDAGVLHVRQTLMRVKGQGIVFGTPKSANSRRTLAIPPTLLAELKAHRKTQTAKRLRTADLWHDSGLVFTLEDGRPLDPSVDARRWRQLLTDAGLPHKRLHDARHSAATIMVAQGVDLRVAMRILGHSQLSVTMRYQHVVDELMVDAARKIDSAFGGG